MANQMKETLHRKTASSGGQGGTMSTEDVNLFERLFAGPRLLQKTVKERGRGKIYKLQGAWVLASGSVRL